MRPFQHQLPNKGNYLNLTLNDMRDITVQLSTLLEVESDLLGQMRMKEVAPLQAEKLKLSQKLESFQRLLATDDTIVRNADDATREEMLTLTDNLAATVEENMRRTSIAQIVNQRVMRTLMDAVREQQSTGAYGKKGVTRDATHVPISLNLNERA